jgi:hypothetical protein
VFLNCKDYDRDQIFYFQLPRGDESLKLVQGQNDPLQVQKLTHIVCKVRKKVRKKRQNKAHLNAQSFLIYKLRINLSQKRED